MTKEEFKNLKPGDVIGYDYGELFSLRYKVLEPPKFQIVYVETGKGAMNLTEKECLRFSLRQSNEGG